MFVFKTNKIQLFLVSEGRNLSKVERNWSWTNSLPNHLHHHHPNGTPYSWLKTAKPNVGDFLGPSPSIRKPSSLKVAKMVLFSPYSHCEYSLKSQMQLSNQLSLVRTFCHFDYLLVNFYSHCLVQPSNSQITSVSCKFSRSSCFRPLGSPPTVWQSMPLLGW